MTYKQDIEQEFGEITHLKLVKLPWYCHNDYKAFFKLDGRSYEVEISYVCESEGIEGVYEILYCSLKKTSASEEIKKLIQNKK